MDTDREVEVAQQLRAEQHPRGHAQVEAGAHELQAVQHSDDCQEGAAGTADEQLYRGVDHAGESQYDDQKVGFVDAPAEEGTCTLAE